MLRRIRLAGLGLAAVLACGPDVNNRGIWVSHNRPVRQFSHRDCAPEKIRRPATGITEFRRAADGPVPELDGVFGTLGRASEVNRYVTSDRPPPGLATTWPS